MFDTPNDMRDRIEAKYKQFVDQMRHCLKKYGINMTVEVPYLDDRDIEMLQELAPTLEQLHENEVENGVRILAASEENMLLSILGAVQGGKTNSAIHGIALRSVHGYLVNGKVSDYIYLVPGDYSIQETTEKSWKSYVSFYGRVLFSSGKKSISFGDVCEKHLNNKNSNGVNFNKIYPLTNKKEFHEEIIEYINEAARTKTHCVILIDEAQHGDGKGGIADRLLGEAMLQIKSGKNPYVRLWFLSATPWPYHNLCYPVHLRLGGTYVGFNMHEGKLIDEDIPVRTPEILGYSDLRNRYKLNIITEICVRATFFDEGGIKAFARFIKRVFRKPASSKLTTKEYEESVAKRVGFPKTISQEKYAVLACLSVRHMVESMILRDTRSSYGCMMRVMSDNGRTMDFIRRLKLNPAIGSIVFTQKLPYEKFKEQVKECHRRKQPFIVLVTGKARRSNRIPKEVGYFLELTERFSTATAAIQGLPGRASGYGKGIPLVVVSDDNAYALKEYIRTLGKSYPAPVHSRTKKDGVKTMRYPCFSLAETMTKPSVKRLFDLWASELEPKFKRRNDHKRIRGDWYDWEALFPESLLQELEREYNFRLLRLGETPLYTIEENNPKQYHADKLDRIFIAARSVNDSKKDWDGLGTKKNSSINQSDLKGRGLEPHAHFNRQTGRLEYIELALFEEVEYNYSLAVPTKKSMYFDLMGEAKEGGVA